MNQQVSVGQFAKMPRAVSGEERRREEPRGRWYRTAWQNCTLIFGGYREDLYAAQSLGSLMYTCDASCTSVGSGMLASSKLVLPAFSIDDQYAQST
jgi:hypothetical protein